MWTMLMPRFANTAGDTRKTLLPTTILFIGNFVCRQRQSLSSHIRLFPILIYRWSDPSSISSAKIPSFTLVSLVSPLTNLPETLLADCLDNLVVLSMILVVAILPTFYLISLNKRNAKQRRASSKTGAHVDCLPVDSGT